MKGRSFSDLSNKVIGCAIEVHKTLGPGLLESSYQQCLAHELKINQIEFKLEYPLPVKYKGIHLDCAYRLDFLVEDKIILELKSIEQLNLEKSVEREFIVQDIDFTVLSKNLSFTRRLSGHFLEVRWNQELVLEIVSN